MNIVFDTFTLSSNSIERIDFFNDFIAFIRRLQEQPIKRTLTGNISLRDIEALLKELRTTRERINTYRKHGWSLRTEHELKTLEQIKILAEVMRLTYKRKKRLMLSKNGQEFLNVLTPLQQYKQMILHFWYRVNWDYFTGMARVKDMSISDVLQENQNKIWHFLLCKNTEWIDYGKFCLALRDYFQLEVFLENSFIDPEKEFFSDMEYVFLKTNLLLFNCIEVEYKEGETPGQRQIRRFRSTRVGLYLYQKALYENYF